MRSHGITKDRNGFNIMSNFGYNYRLTDIQSALGLSQLKKLDKFIRQRRKISSWYNSELKKIKDIILPLEISNIRSAWHIYVIRTKDPKARGKLAKYLKNNGIGINFHYPSVYSHPYYKENGYAKIQLSNEEIYSNSCITLPLYPALSRKEVKYVCDKIKSFYLQ